MSSIQHLVSPKLPTTLADQTHVDLPGYDIWLSYVNILYVVPTELDVSRFEGALSRVLQLYPHAAGQLRHIDQRWLIELTNTAIPVKIAYKLDSSSDSLLHGGWVIQDDLSPFIDVQQFGASVIDGSDGPLLRVKLTFFDNETCIGASWNHSLGDGTVLFRFLHTLSQLYQGLSPEFATPSFKKYHFPTPSYSVVAEFWPRIPHLHKPYDFDAPAKPSKRCEHMRWRINSRDIEDLYSAISSKKQSGPSLSKQDCITAYLVAVLNHNRSNPVQKVINITSYRHMKASFITENAASNLLLNVTADVPVNIAGIATAVRNALIRYRDPDYIYNWVALSSNVILEAVNARKAFTFPVRDDVTVNSYSGIDWCSAHFGCPDGTQFHLDTPSRNSAKFARSNPVKGVDGVWKACQSIDISIGVEAGLKPKLLETLAHGVRYMLEDQHIQL